jgi:hypothetical protein
MEKSEALRLADAIEKAIRPEASLPLGDWARAAAELRRLSAVEAQRDALLEACKAYDKWAHKTLCYDRELRPIRAQIRAAIKAVEGEKT